MTDDPIPEVTIEGFTPAFRLTDEQVAALNRGCVMPGYRKKPVVIEATQWFQNGDHPEDGVGETAYDPMTRRNYRRVEGKVVRFYRHPPVDPVTGEISAGGSSILLGELRHHEAPGPHRNPDCNALMDEHGWIDTPEGGHVVCPSDWIITGVAGERYPCKDSIFVQTYMLDEQGGEPR